MKKRSIFLNQLSPTVNFSLLERKILKWWYQGGVVKQYLQLNKDSKKRFRFLDGPITANNPMGVHHAHGRTLKDFFQRYKNMGGFGQRFQNGFDCQGLWVEVEEEKDRGFNSKPEIEAFGLAEFSLACRKRVAKYAALQTEQSKRLGMFMDWDNSYYTMSEANNLYIWHFLKICHQRGWLYKGTDSMPWCIRCGTAISQHELSDEGYREAEHDSLYVKLPVKDEDCSLLIWTTTPWTLLANVAVAVKPDLKYLKVETEGEKLILAASRIEVLTGKYRVIGNCLGRELVNKSYHGPFDELTKPGQVNHQVIPWEEVSESEGTGLVHIAPGGGHEDFVLGQSFNLDNITALDEFGVYLDGFGEYSGQSVRDVPEKIIKDLKEKKRLYRLTKVVHRYPYCWRCKEELVFRTTSEWFIKVEEIRPRLKEAAAKVNWIPAYAEKRMQDWLNQMGDWPISRKRFWGLALPFYECGCGQIVVVGSKEELRELAVDSKAVDDLPELHRPWIDEIKINCPQCGKTVSRIPEVGDCWLDAGIVPFSTVKYLEDKKFWQKWYPFDLITEYIAQVKLWFYATLFMSVTLEGKAPWKTVLASGFIVDERGETMHKSKGNAIWFDEAVEKMGADVMRWIYLSKDIFGNLRFGFQRGEEVRRRFQMILWNAVVFFLTFVKIDHWSDPGDHKNQHDNLSLLDRWMLSRLHRTILSVTEAAEAYDPPRGARAINDLVLDFSTWYLRRSRERVDPSAGDSDDKKAFYATSHQALITLSKLLAPYTPFMSELIYQELRQAGDPRSVHLCTWPPGRKRLINDSLEKKMEIVRQAAELGRAARQKIGLKVRQPLASAVIQLAGAGLVKEEELIKLLEQELNIKQVKLAEGEEMVKLDDQLTPELRQEGQAREIFRKVQSLRKEKDCRRTERLSLVVIPDCQLDQHWLDWVKTRALADDLRLGPEIKIQKYG